MLFWLSLMFTLLNFLFKNYVPSFNPGAHLRSLHIVVCFTILNSVCVEEI